jgi:hypothetical protein
MALAVAIVAGNATAFAQGKKGGGGGGGTPAYQVVRLAVPGALQRSTWAYDLNDRGNVVGEYDNNAGIPHGFHYERSTNSYRSLGIGATARGVNQFDEIAGNDEIENVGLYWSSPAAEPVPLPPLAGHTHSRASKLNNAGIIIGASFIPEDAPVTPGFHAAVAWRVDAQGVVSGPVELPYLAGDIVGAANDLTEAEDGVAIVVGTSGDTGSALPVSWAVMVGEDGLAVIGPTQFVGNYFLAEPWTINSFGDTCGRAAFGNGAAGMPFVRRAGQPVAALPILPNAFSGSAVGINDAGLIVGGQGVTLKQGVGTRAVLWPSATTVVDLNSLVSLGKSESLTWSLRINSAGDILAIINGGFPCLLIRK